MSDLDNNATRDARDRLDAHPPLDTKADDFEAIRASVHPANERHEGVEIHGLDEVMIESRGE